jgi:hypothetical protein
VLAVVAVTITVVYLAIQMRENTRATRSQTYQLATSALAEMAGIIGSDKELARVFRIGMTAPDKLDEDETVQFGYLGISLFRRFENVFFQYQSGMIDDDFWNGHRDNILWVLSPAGHASLVEGPQVRLQQEFSRISGPVDAERYRFAADPSTVKQSAP